MAPSEAQKRASNKYNLNNMATLGCKVHKAEAETFREYAQSQGKTPNMLLKNFVMQCIHPEDVYCYPAVFGYEEGKEISVVFHDFDAATSGANDVDALASAKELLICVLSEMIQDGKELPSPTPLSLIKTEKQERAVLVEVHLSKN